MNVFLDDSPFSWILAMHCGADLGLAAEKTTKVTV
jgi:hypothetical protein